jgi:signal transduction histidine kinase
VLQNLISNARLAMRSSFQDDSGEIRICARSLPPIGGECSTGNTGDVEIRVRDTGPGVSEQVRARLFEPFVTSRAGQGGFGLGLAVCKRLIEQAGGTIDLAPSGIEDGAEFIITLPRARPSK